MDVSYLRRRVTESVSTYAGQFICLLLEWKLLVCFYKGDGLAGAGWWGFLASDFFFFPLPLWLFRPPLSLCTGSTPHFKESNFLWLRGDGDYSTVATLYISVEAETKEVHPLRVGDLTPYTLMPISKVSRSSRLLASSLLPRRRPSTVSMLLSRWSHRY